MTTSQPSTEPAADKMLAVAPDAVAPDGSLVRLLVRSVAGSMAHFELGAGEVSIAQRHRTVTECWYILEGQGQMWRKQNGSRGKTIDLRAGVALTIPVGTSFQFRNTGRAPLAAVAATIPPWPEAGDATEVQGAWEPSLGQSGGMRT